MKKIFLTLKLVLFVIPFGISQDLPSYVPTNGLVAYYPFNGNANDESGNGNHGTVNGATLTSDRNDVQNSSYSFDGLDDYISINSNNNQLDFFGNCCITISAWIKLDNANKQYSILTNSDYNNIHQQYALKVESNSKLYFIAGDKLFESNGINYSSSSINNGQWTHTLVSYDGNKLKLYLNGNLDYENQIIDNFPESPSSVAFIGNSWGANNDFFPGQIDDVGIWNRALTEKEIQNLYTSSTGDIKLNGIVSAENNQIKNLEDPTHPQDAVTKNYTYSKTEVDALISEIKTELGNQIDNDGDGYTENGGDCDDSDLEINPAANEICDNIDNNCNSEIDEGVTNPYYQDVDGDGFGLNGIGPVMACSPPEGYVSNNQDCDDSNSAVYPGAPEISDGIDNDCDGQVDELVPNYVPSNGLVAFYPFAGDLEDKSGNEYHLTNSNVSFTDDANLTSNHALYFNGNSSHLYTSTSFSELTSDPNQTISFWFKNISDNWRAIFTIGDSDGARIVVIPNTIDEKIAVSGAGDCHLCGEDGGYGIDIEVNNFKDGWHHIVVSTNSNELKLYLNGNLISTTNHSGFNCDNDNYRLWLGNDIVCAPEWFEMNMDDVGIWDRELSEGEINNLFQRN